MSQPEGSLPTIGVVIPALNEEATIADQVAEVLAVAEQPGQVADGRGLPCPNVENLPVRARIVGHE